MKKLILFLGLAVFLANCTANLTSLRPGDEDKLPKDQKFGYIYFTYSFKETTTGARWFAVELTDLEKKDDMRIDFKNQKQPDYALVPLKVGKYSINRVYYYASGNIYSHQPIGVTVQIDENKIYYLGNFNVFKGATKMKRVKGASGLIDSIAADWENWDYTQTQSKDVDKSILDKDFPKFKDFPYESIMK